MMPKYRFPQNYILIMGFISFEEEAIEQINNINAEMRAIRVLMGKNGDVANVYIREQSLPHISNIDKYVKKYLRAKEELEKSNGVNLFLYGRSVDVWNGENVPVIVWEEYFMNTFKRLAYSINNCY